MNDQDKEFLIQTLEEKSINATNSRDFFKSLAFDAKLPKAWYPGYLSQIKDDSHYSAQNIVGWAIDMNRKDQNFTTLGSLFYPLLKTVGLDTAQRLVSIMVSNHLILNDQKLIQLAKEYGVSFPTEGTAGHADRVNVLDIAEIQERMIRILLLVYENSMSDPRQFFFSLCNDLKWPPGWYWEPSSSALDSAQSLVRYLIAQRSYPPGIRAGFKPLGALLYKLIPRVGGGAAAEIYQIITDYELIENTDIMADLKQKYCPTQ